MSSRESPTTDSTESSGSRLKLGIAGAVLITILAASAWLLSEFAATDPALQLQLALDKLDEPDDPIAWETARRLALRVKSSDYRDPDFAGAVEFIQGVVETRADKNDPDRLRRIAAAAKLLLDAERLGLDESRRPEWTFALGRSYVEIGQAENARPLLEEAWISYPTGAIEVGLDLADIELDDPTPDSVRFTPAILDRIGSQAILDEEIQRRLTALRAQLALRLGKLENAAVELDRLGDGTRDPEVALMRADLCLAQNQLDEARRWLLPLAFPETHDRPSESVIAAAAYRLGRCDELRGDATAAARAFSKAASALPGSADGTAGSLDAARLYQQAGRDEEAITHFRQAIEAQSSTEARPLRAEQFRAAIRAACELWLEREVFDSAITLALISEPILGQVESLDWQARGSEQQAERMETLWMAANETKRAELQSERREYWRQSGAAFRSLASKVSDSGRAATALWAAADYFRRGQDFQQAIEALDEVLELKLEKMEAAALVRRGRAALDLGRPADAAADFEMMLETHPTDPEAFEARFLLGRSYLDAGDTPKAEATWRELLALTELTPDAAEWRSALFSLAELLYRRGVAAVAKADLESSTEGRLASEAVLPLDEAIARFDEFLRRTPADERAPEARVLRSDAMRRRADLAQRRADVAETENLREAARKEAERLLLDAIAELRKAQATLVPLADRDRLPPLAIELLKTTFFDLGHAFSALHRDREALIAYGGAVNRYPDDPRVVMAYLRMAECHRRLGRADDARAALEQARLSLEQLPADSPAGGASALSRTEWAAWLERLRKDGILAGTP